MWFVMHSVSPSKQVKLTQSKGRFTEPELVVVMAAVHSAVCGGGRRGGRLPHQQIIVEPVEAESVVWAAQWRPAV